MVAGILAATGPAAPAQSASDQFGVKHVITVSVSGDAAKYATRDGDPPTGDIIVRVYVADTSQEAGRMFGVLATRFQNIKLDRPSPDQIVYQDAVCHHERGIPKITVRAVEGSITRNGQQEPLAAVVRTIGKHVPDDEVSVGMRLPAGNDSVGPFTSMRSETHTSRLFIVVKLYTLTCTL